MIVVEIALLASVGSVCKVTALFIQSLHDLQNKMWVLEKKEEQLLNKIVHKQNLIYGLIRKVYFEGLFGIASPCSLRVFAVVWDGVLFLSFQKRKLLMYPKQSKRQKLSARTVTPQPNWSCLKYLLCLRNECSFAKITKFQTLRGR